MSPQIAFTFESKVDDGKKGDISRRQLKDPAKLSNTEPLNATSNLVPSVTALTSRSSTTNLLMQTTPGPPAALVFNSNPYPTHEKGLFLTTSILTGPLL